MAPPRSLLTEAEKKIKHAKRAENNRLAAQRCRERRRKEYERLLRLTSKQQQEIGRLKGVVSELEREVRLQKKNNDALFTALEMKMKMEQEVVCGLLTPPDEDDNLSDVYLI